MLKKIVLIGSVALLFAAILPAYASAQTDAKRAEKAANVRSKLEKLGAGRSSVVKIKLYDKTELRGYLGRLGGDDFDVVDSAGNPHTVRYADVDSIGGKNLSSGAKIAIGVGIGAGVTILVLFLILAHLD